MPTRTIETPEDRNRCISYLVDQELPLTVSIMKGRKRSTKQNRLQRLWINEIAEQCEGSTPEWFRGYCKLRFGVPILRAENDEFRVQYDRVVKPLLYEDKISIMMEPLDLPVTRIMTTKQKKQYLDAMAQHFAEQGVKLTDPDDLSTNWGPPV